MKYNEKNIEEIENLLKDCDEGITFNRLVYKIPKRDIDFIKNNNYKFSHFVLMAIEEKIQKIKGTKNGKK